MENQTEAMEQGIGRLKERLAAGVEKAVIIPHISPDGDAVGSCSALAEALRLAGIR